MSENLAILKWLREPRAGAGLHFLQEDGTWRDVTYEQLAGRTAALAEALRERGLERRAVAMIGESSEEFLSQYFAVLATGGTCIALPPFYEGQDRAAHDRLVQGMVQQGRPDVVLGTASQAIPAAPVRHEVVPSFAELPSTGPIQITPTDLPAAVMFTSGTTGEAPKAVRATRQYRDDNFSAWSRACGLRSEDRWATWLPMWRSAFHLPMLQQCDLFVMTSLQFLSQPDIWLRCFGALGCTATGGPSFGYQHARTTANLDDLADCRFDGWRLAQVYGQPMSVGEVEAFVATFGPLGFQRRSFSPTYRLTDAGIVAVTAADEEPATWNGRATAMDRLVGAGRPFDPDSVSVQAADGTEAAEGVLGEIRIHRSAIPDQSESGAQADEWYATGDVGGFQDGVLFVFGRLADSFQVRGAVILAEQAEQAVLQSLPDLEGAVVVPHRRAGVGITAVVESTDTWPPERGQEAAEALATRFGNIEVDLVVVGPGGIPRTETGKPQRRQAWARYVTGGEGP